MPRLDQLLGRVAERSVPDVVQQGREPRGVAILVVHPRYEFITVGAETPSIVGVPLKSPDHTFCGFYDSPRMLKAVVARTRIDEVGHPELAHAAQPLKHWRVQKHRFPR